MVSGVDGPGGDEAVLADIRAAQDGDAGAYARLVESWGGRLLRFCHNNLPATIDAEDAVPVSYTHLTLPTIYSV